MKVLIDSYVLINFLSNGRSSVGLLDFQHTIDLIKICERHPQLGYVSLITLANVDYVLYTDMPKRALLHDFLQFLQVASPETLHVKMALNFPLPEIEDALQLAAALQIKADYIITYKKDSYPSSPIPIVTPTEFLALAP